MKLKKTLDPGTLMAVTTLLTPSFPGLTSEKLMDALTSYDGIKKEAKKEIKKALTRKEASDLLHVSLPTINRLMNNGTLKRIKLKDAHNGGVRIEYSSVEKLLE